MADAVKQRVIDEYARDLAKLWVDNMTLSGARAFRENEDKRAELLRKADDLGIRNEVYARANTIMHGN
jgi:hypothetical protein